MTDDYNSPAVWSHYLYIQQIVFDVFTVNILCCLDYRQGN